MIDLDIQNPAGFDSIPERRDLLKWIQAALQKPKEDVGIVIRFVDKEEGVELNYAYRQKSGEEKRATNVLSFPSELEDFDITHLNERDLSELNQQKAHLGDLILCEPVVKNEAQLQKKELHHHWAHLVIHGTLHLQGYDHISDEDACIMEALEVKILDSLGFVNPYDIEEENIVRAN